MATTQLYSLRAGRGSDVPALASIWAMAFEHDAIWGMSFPGWQNHRSDFDRLLQRRLAARVWAPMYSLTVLEDAATRQPVGFGLWRKPMKDLSFYERWLSPSTWFSFIVRGYHAVRDFMFPIRTIDNASGGAFSRVMNTLEPGLLNTDRRTQGWYLSILAVDPSLQGKGLGSLLLRDGLQRAQDHDRITWLVALENVDKFYTKHGFVEVARANVGELKDWKGGAIMFRE